MIFDPIMSLINGLRTKVGNATLTTTAQDLSGGVNELNDQIINYGTPSAYTTVAENYEYTATENCFVFITVQDSSGTPSATHASGVKVQVNSTTITSLWSRWNTAVDMPILVPLKKNSVMKLVKNDNWPTTVKVSVL